MTMANHEEFNVPLTHAEINALVAYLLFSDEIQDQALSIPINSAARKLIKLNDHIFALKRKLEELKKESMSDA